jgi:hypothetical protein
MAKAMQKQMRKQMRWKSRDGPVRTYEIFNDTLTVMCYGVSSYAFSLDAEQNTISVDPTGGPRFFIGQRVTHKEHEWTIQSIMYHYKKDSTAVFVFGISP